MNSKINNIDSLRALAVMSVFLHHCSSAFNLSIPFFGQFGGQFGVQLFFVISGYLISLSAQRHTLRNYALQRGFRIFPAYLILYIVLGIGVGTLNLQALQQDWQAFVINLLSLQHIFPAALVNYDVFHVSWTLTIELFWYFIAPVIVILLRSHQWLIVGLSFLISVAWVFLASQGNLDFIYSDQHIATGQAIEHFRVLFLHNAFPGVLCFFMLGALVARIQNTLTQLPNSWLLACFVLLSVIWPYFAPLPLNPNFLYGIGLAGLLVFCLSIRDTRIKPVKWLANVSYSFYLVHFTAILYLANNLNLSGIWQALAAFILSFAVATISYIVIERPMIKFGKRYSQQPSQSIVASKSKHPGTKKARQ